MELFLDAEGQEEVEEGLLPFNVDVLLALGIEQEPSPLDRELDAIFQRKSNLWCCQECDPCSILGGCAVCHILRDV